MEYWEGRKGQVGRLNLVSNKFMVSEDHHDLGFPNIPVGSISLQLLNVVKEFGHDMVCSRGRHDGKVLKVSSQMLLVWLQVWAHNLS